MRASFGRGPAILKLHFTFILFDDQKGCTWLNGMSEAECKHRWKFFSFLRDPQDLDLQPHRCLAQPRRYQELRLQRRLRHWVPMRACLRSPEFAVQVFSELVGDRALQRFRFVVRLVPWIAKYTDQEMLKQVVTTEDPYRKIPSIIRQLNVLVALLSCKPQAFQPT